MLIKVKLPGLALINLQVSFQQLPRDPIAIESLLKHLFNSHLIWWNIEIVHEAFETFCNLNPFFLVGSTRFFEGLQDFKSQVLWPVWNWVAHLSSNLTFIYSLQRLEPSVSSITILSNWRKRDVGQSHRDGQPLISASFCWNRFAVVNVFVHNQSCLAFFLLLNRTHRLNAPIALATQLCSQL